MRGNISVITPSLPSRIDLLGRAMGSAYGQTLQPREVCVATDTQRKGAARTRQRALEMANSDWVAFLDDDDEFLPDHLWTLWETAQVEDADYVFSWFVRSRGGDPLGHFGKPFDPTAPHHTTVTVMCRRDLALEAGFESDDPTNPYRSGEDWRFTLRCIELGAHIVHVPKETWIWHRHAGNTSGLVGKGDAR